MCSLFFGCNSFFITKPICLPTNSSKKNDALIFNFCVMLQNPTKKSLVTVFSYQKVDIELQSIRVLDYVAIYFDQFVMMKFSKCSLEAMHSMSRCKFYGRQLCLQERNSSLINLFESRHFTPKHCRPSNQNSRCFYVASPKQLSHFNERCRSKAKPSPL